MATTRLLDGGLIREALLPESNFSERAKQRFTELGSTGLTHAQVRAAAEAEAVALLLGQELAAAGVGIPLPPMASSSSGDDVNYDEDTFVRTLREYLHVVADLFRDEPVEISVYDGQSLKALLEDEDEFAMVAEDIFVDFDSDKDGKLSLEEVKLALDQLVAELSLSTPSAKPDMNELASKLFIKYAGEGKEDLHQVQFARLLQDIIQDLTDSLAANPIVTVRNVKVLDGSYIRKVLEDETFLSEITDGVFHDLDKNKDKKLSKSEVRPIFESFALEWGLPPPPRGEDPSHSEDIYQIIFKEMDADGSGELSKDEFQVLLKSVFESFSLQLKMNPVLVDVNLDRLSI